MSKTRKSKGILSSSIKRNSEVKKSRSKSESINLKRIEGNNNRKLKLNPKIQRKLRPIRSLIKNARKFFLSIFTFELLSKYYRGFLSERLSQHIIKMYLLCLPYSLFYSEHQDFLSLFPPSARTKICLPSLLFLGTQLQKNQMFVSSLFYIC